jgi:hypothetical protein
MKTQKNAPPPVFRVVCHEIDDNNCARHLGKEPDPCRKAVKFYTEEPVLPVDAEDEEKNKCRQDKGTDEADEQEYLGGFHNAFCIHAARCQVGRVPV